MSSPRIYVGTSGFSYKHWKGVFYPEDITQKEWFNYYQEKFSTVELNTTFYHLPKKQIVEKWRDESPRGFTFSLKGSRYITHMKRLKDPKEPLAKFYNAIDPLLEKTGTVLFQMPERAKKNISRLENFLNELEKYNTQNVFELRHSSWWDGEVFDLLRRYNSCFCWYSMPGSVPPEEVTADFLYVRMHGSTRLYKSKYRSSTLEKLAKKIYKLDVDRAYIYFNNDSGGHAAQNALELKEVINE